MVAAPHSEVSGTILLDSRGDHPQECQGAAKQMQDFNPLGAKGV